MSYTFKIRIEQFICPPLSPHVKQIHLGGFLLLGQHLFALTKIQIGSRIQEAAPAIQDAMHGLMFLLKGEHVPVIKESKIPAEQLLASLNAAIQLNEPESTVVYTKEIHGQIQNFLHPFLIIFQNELAGLPVYYVVRKGLYDMRALIEVAQDAFPEEVKLRLTPFTVEDMRSAGRCLAFELPTASGFHSLRALEAVVVDYLQKLKAQPQKRDLGAYVVALNANGADAKATAVVDQLRGLHRNPLMHPQDTLNTNEAIGVFELCKNAITALIQDMENRKLFPV